VKKFIALCFALILIMSAAYCLGTAAAAASAPTLLWDFGEDERMSASMGANSLNAVSYWGEKDAAGNDYYVFVAGSNDPYISVDLSAADVSEIVWVKARVKNAGPATAIELFGHTGGRGLIGSECTHIDIAGDDEWHTYVVYIPDENVRTVNTYKDPQYAVSGFYWEGTVDWIRLDPMWQEGDDGSDSGGSMRPGDEIFIDYIAFFPTEAEAKAFRSGEDEGNAASGTPAGSGNASAEDVSAGEASAESGPAASPGGFASAEEAAGGRNIITGCVLLSGTDGFEGEGPENLLDGDTSTNFRTDKLPAEAVLKLNGVYNIVGCAMATASDSEERTGCSPDVWTISVSSDGTEWIELVSGDGTFFGGRGRTYYAADAYVYGVSYVKLSVGSTPSGTVRLSELTLFGDLLAPADEEPQRGTGGTNFLGYAVTAVIAGAAGFLAGFAAGRKKR
jgi:hypothetical protein